MTKVTELTEVPEKALCTIFKFAPSGANFNFNNQRHTLFKSGELVRLARWDDGRSTSFTSVEELALAIVDKRLQLE